MDDQKPQHETPVLSQVIAVQYFTVVINLNHSRYSTVKLYHRQCILMLNFYYIKLLLINIEFRLGGIVVPFENKLNDG